MFLPGIHLVQEGPMGETLTLQARLVGGNCSKASQTPIVNLCNDI
jgi:hypothetical protein